MDPWVAQSDAGGRSGTALDLIQTLRDAGYAVIGPCSSVEVALDHLCEQQPQIAILDIDLNGHHSYPVADALAREQVPFIWLSASPPEIVPAMHRDRPFLSKPFLPAQIVQLVSDVLKGA